MISQAWILGRIMRHLSKDPSNSSRNHSKMGVRKLESAQFVTCFLFSFCPDAEFQVTTKWKPKGNLLPRILLAFTVLLHGRRK